VKNLTQYKFSSYDTLSRDNKTILCRNELMEWFGGRNRFIKYHTEMKNNLFNDDYMIED